MGKVVSGVTDALGITDSKAGTGELAASQAQMREVLQRLDKVDLPDYAKEAAFYELLQAPELLAEYSPEELAMSKVSQIETDPELISAQREALAQMQEFGRTGLGEEDILAAKELQRGVARQEQARQAQIQREMAQRGMGDSGVSLAAKLSSSQAASNRAAEEANRIAMEAARARRAAVGQSADLASRLRGQEFGEAERKASAEDIINRFNTQQRNLAQQQNIAQRQKYADIGTELQNKKLLAKAGMERQKFQDKMQKAGAMGTAQQNYASQLGQIGAGKQQAAAQQMGGLMQMGTTLGAAAIMSDRRVKEGVERAKSDEIISKLEGMLDELKGYNYEYKDDDYMPGEQTGIMAQDLEKSEMGQEFVSEAEDGTKMVDYQEMAPTMAAGLAELHRRVKKLEGDY